MMFMFQRFSGLPTQGRSCGSVFSKVGFTQIVVLGTFWKRHPHVLVGRKSNNSRPKKPWDLSHLQPLSIVVSSRKGGHRRSCFSGKSMDMCVAPLRGSWSLTRPPFKGSESMARLPHGLT